MKIVVDAMGGDNAPEAIIDGCRWMLSDYDDVSVILVGDREKIEACLEAKDYDKERVEIVHAADVIDNEEKPALAVRRKPESSIVKGLRIVSEGNADAFLSAGSTGAVLAGATLIVKRLDGIIRPALAPVLPTSKGGVLLIDCGANVDCKPEYLEQFAIMGSAYMNCIQDVDNPRVALINNGAEEGKGNELAKAAYPLLAKLPINFVGNVEGREIISGDIDVAVTDGFVGNVLMKFMEGAAKTIFGMLKEEFTANVRTKIGSMLLMQALQNFKKKMDYTEYGGAPFLGVSKTVVKAHGSSNAKAIYSALKQTRQMISEEVVENIKEGIGTQLAAGKQ